jgi:hypothetical protein
MRRALVVMVSAFVGLTAVSGSAQLRTADIQRILLDSLLWGRDFPAALAVLRAYAAAGETTLYIFADRAAGGTPFGTAAAAQSPLAKAREAIVKPPNLQPPFAAMQKQAAQPAGGPLRIEAAKIIDGDGYHLVAVRTGQLELLPPGLTIATVRSRLGAPEQVTKRTIHAEGESKPIVLTLHVYAGGAIAFAESNMAEPGVVERVVLNVTAVSPAVVR